MLDAFHTLHEPSVFKYGQISDVSLLLVEGERLPALLLEWQKIEYQHQDKRRQQLDKLVRQQQELPGRSDMHKGLIERALVVVKVPFHDLVYDIRCHVDE